MKKDKKKKVRPPKSKRSLFDKKFISFYYHIMARYRVGIKKTVFDVKDLRKIQSEIFKTIREHYVNNDGGVYINNLGYFCHMMVPESRMAITPFNKTIRYEHTNGYMFKHLVLDDRKGTGKYYSIFSDVLALVKKESNTKIKNGKRYKFLYREVESEKECFGKIKIRTP